jgi:methylated-DNA-protein-cysteine methyltransferase-like protein
MRSRGERRRPAPAARGRRSRTAGNAAGGRENARVDAARHAAGGAAEDAGEDVAEFVGQRYAAIYRVVRRIPRGHVLTYGQVAELAGMPGAARAVGAAMRASTPEQGLPWQRVVGKRGPGLGLVRIHDPMGAGMQRALLEGEGVTFTSGDAISLADHGWIPAIPRPRPHHRHGRGPSSPPPGSRRRRRPVR